MNNIPIQLDLESGLVVGHKTTTVKEEFCDDDHKNHDCHPINGDDFYDSNELPTTSNCTIKQESDGEDEVHDYDSTHDAYCMDYYELPNQDTICESHTVNEHTIDGTKKGQIDSKQPNKISPAPRPLKTIIGPPPSLLRQSTQIVASNIEKYHPASFSIFSECIWESVVKCRCEKYDETKARNPNKLLMPPISTKFLTRIEDFQGNIHLRDSHKIDELLWEKIVDYSFPKGGITRPIVLNEPYRVLVNRLVDWSKELIRIFVWEDKQHDNNEVRVKGRWIHEHDVIVKQESENESDDNDNNHTELVSICNVDDPLRDQGRHSRRVLIRFLDSVRTSPIDVKILSDTGIGKAVSKVVKIATKLLKKVREDGIIEDEADALKGYPDFWSKNHTIDHEEVNLLQVLQLLLEEWKDVASKNGVKMSSTDSETAQPKKKQKTHYTNVPKEKAQCFATFAKQPNIDDNQHQANMKLLHESPTWKALYYSLRKREKMVREAHGEKVRATRENLAKNRPKVGKVVLKKAVGRVRGSESSNNMHRSFSKQDRQEAILNKSLGQQAQTARSTSMSCNSPSRSSSKLSQLRQESKVASKWSKGTQKTVSKISHTNSTPTSAFGASVARAGGGNSATNSSKPKMVGNQARVDLQGGKRMTLPAAASAKSVGMFSSLQKGSASKKSASGRISLKKVGKRRR